MKRQNSTIHLSVSQYNDSFPMYYVHYVVTKTFFGDRMCRFTLQIHPRVLQLPFKQRVHQPSQVFEDHTDPHRSLLTRATQRELNSAALFSNTV